MKSIIKIGIFAALMGIYWIFGGFTFPPHGESVEPLCAITTAYIGGAMIALFGGEEPIGDLHPISLRPIFICVGALLAIGAFAAMIATTRDKKDTALPTLPRMAGPALRSCLCSQAGPLLSLKR